MPERTSSRTIVELLLEQTARRPDLSIYTFLGDGKEESEGLTLAALERVAQGIGAALADAGLVGERALLLYPPGLDFIGAFLGCLCAGTVAVPAYPPRSARGQPRLYEVARDAQPRAVLTTTALMRHMRAHLQGMPGLADMTWLATDGLEARAAEWKPPLIDGDTLAFLQYTSGSTSTPKGVMISHFNLLHNEEMIRRAFDQSEESVIVGWLPLYHDMGLIGNVLQPLYVGARCILMPPVSFLQSPMRWLAAISRYRATTSGGPNFAYDLCCRKITSDEEKRALDLSSWRVAFNGAEPVRPETLERFTAAFAACGFRRTAIYPCYGLAEATLFVSGGTVEAGPVVAQFRAAPLEQGEIVKVVGDEAAVRRLVGCGRPWVDQRVAIVDPGSGEEIGPGQVGEIWVAGESISNGYWQRPEETTSSFGCYLPDGAGPFLRTGDLGFVDGGELFLSGRKKELIILRGRNFFPQDIEMTAERAHPLLRPNCAAAFSVEDEGEERLVVVQEVERRAGSKDLTEVIEAILAAVAAEHEALLWDVVLIHAGTLPKTSSGKVQRRACRIAWQEGRLKVVARLQRGSAPTVPKGEEEPDPAGLLALEDGERRAVLEGWLRGRLATMLRLDSDRISIRAPLVALGLDSLAAAELNAEVETKLGVAILSALLKDASLADLADEVLMGLTSAAPDLDAVASRIVRGDTVGDLPLSYGQRALWFLQASMPGSAAWNITAAFEVHGDLDASALGRAFQALVDRHPALRTTYHAAGGEPVQRIHPIGRVDLSFREVSGAADEAVAGLLRREVYRPFDLASGPLMRVFLLRRATRVHAVGFAVHHIAADFWSLAVMWDELAGIYAAESGGTHAVLPPLTVTYVDWVRWQNNRLAGPEGERLWVWWRERLSESVSELHLPTDRPRPPVQTDRGFIRRRVMALPGSAALLALASSSGATLFATLLAGFMALLHRICGQDDVAVGCPVSGRSAPEVAGLVGYFVNPVVVRSDQYGGNLTGAGLLAQVRSAALAALEHADYPFVLLTERLRPVRDASRSPLFQVMFVFQQSRRPEQGALARVALGESGAVLYLGPLELRSIALGEKPAQLDLALSVTHADEGVALSLHVNGDLFDPATTKRMLGHLVTLLEALAAEPDQLVSDLPLLTPAERGQILVAWNDTAAETPRALVHELFARQANRTPERVAVVQEEAQGGLSMTYRELASRSGALAAYLRRLGVGPEVPVGICLGRTLEMVMGVLGVLAAGGCYLPLDPSYPAERIAYLLADSGAGLVLTDRRSRSVLGEWAGRCVCLDTDAAQFREVRGPLRGGGSDPGNLAYVIYTSGSTGRPKGVSVPHGAVVNLLTSMMREPGLAPDDVLVAITSLSFDISGVELFLPLAVGARVVLAAYRVVRDGGDLLSLLRSVDATVLQAVPTLWRMLLDAGWDGRPRLRALCGGEPLSRELASTIVERAAGLWNLYGPTETTVWSAIQRVEAGPGPIVPVGRPLANTQLFVVGQNREPVPVGVQGELLIGGDGLARGYLCRPDLTAERFVPDGLSGKAGARLFRTGDVAQHRLDGTVEILGRFDHQVKVRGFRIESGEVEAVLQEHQRVRAAVVAAREGRLVAYFVPADEADDIEEGALRDYLSGRLPAPMVPSVFIRLARLPLTANGKLDRAALPAPIAPQRTAAEAPAAPRSDLERALARIWCEVFGIASVGIHDDFFALGGHSLLAAQVVSRIREQTGLELPLVDFFRQPTISGLAARLNRAGLTPQQDLISPPRHAHGRPDVAIIGMAGRFPGAGSVDELWRSLRAGKELITSFTADELLREGVDPMLLADPKYVRAAGVVEDAEMFDAAFFGISPREAELMDPQQRVFLECAWQALEDAGYDSEQTTARIGVYAGVGVNTYLHDTGLGRSQSFAVRYQAFLANDKDFVTTRVSYKLNLRGPSVNVQTACSTSLVALHLACQALATGDCDMALVGGVSIRMPQKEGYLWEEGGILSPDGRCRALDARAQGTVLGNGVGLVVLKRLDRALADGDHVRAVVKGSAINNDGSVKVGYTAPSVDGQASVVREALAASGIEPDTISYIEAHGTGTALGDAIEMAALARVFAGCSDRRGSCAVGSVKTNLGHLDTAAGMAGLIKTVLALEHREIPASLHFESPNSQIGIAASPFHVNAALKTWVAAGAPRRAGVSAFGIGGTNAHVVLEEAPPVERTGESRAWQLLVLSARTSKALQDSTARLALHLREHPELSLADVAHTLRVGRRAFAWRRILVCRETSEAAEALASVGPGGSEARQRSVAFLFPGQGAQYPGMARGLYFGEPVFRHEVDHCAELLKMHLGRDLRELLFAEPGDEVVADQGLMRTELAQPALFTVEYALARLWMDWGVRPDGMLGHSVGEYVAACLAGVFSLEGVLGLVAARGRLIGELPRGSMLAVNLPEAEVLGLLSGDLSLAAVNAATSCVVSGPGEAVEAVERELTSRRIESRRLRTSHAFHSAMMEPILVSFAAEVARAAPRPPSMPWISNVTGTWITSEQAVDPEYWIRHLREPVRFAAGVEEMLKDPARILLEVGPGRTLATLAAGHPARAGQEVVTSLRHPRETAEDQETVLGALGRLWLAGLSLDWRGFESERHGRVPLPTYPFERRRFWFEMPEREHAPPVAKTAAGGRRRDPADWFYRPSWRLAPFAPGVGGNAPRRWMVLAAQDESFATRLAWRLEREGRTVAVVLPGEDLATRLDAMEGSGGLPEAVVHAWSLETIAVELPDPNLHGLLKLARELGRRPRPVDLTVLGKSLLAVTQGEPLRPDIAALLGFCRVLPQEHAHINCRVIDLAPTVPGSRREADLVDRVVREIEAHLDEEQVAWRGSQRWIPDWVPLRLAENGSLREGAAWLVTGGLQGPGYALARTLARETRARLALVEPARPAGADERLEALRALGAEVLALEIDLADESAARLALTKTEERFGTLYGIIHAAGAEADPLRLIQDTRSEDCAAVFRDRVSTLLGLERALSGRAVKTCVLLSSVATALGGVAYASAAGAAAFFDAFAHERRRCGDLPWTSLGWDAWRLEGGGGPPLRDETAEMALSPREGEVAFLRAMAAREVEHLIVSTGDLAVRIARRRSRIEGLRGRASGTDAKVPSSLQPRQLATPYQAPGSEIERRIAAVWEQVLGIAKIGVHDNFFELGGDSFVAIQVVSRLQRELGVDLPVARLFQGLTIRSLVSLLNYENELVARRAAQLEERREGTTCKALRQQPRARTA